MPLNMNGAHGGRMRKVTGVPVLVAGRILDAATAEHAIAVDGVDLVAMTRAVIADPDLPRKYAAGATPDPASVSTSPASAACTRADPCGARSIRESVTLRSTHPSIGSESLGRVVVIGGGVAGAEAAHRAAERGARVTLFERAQHIGGRARIAAQRPRPRSLAPLPGMAV